MQNNSIVEQLRELETREASSRYEPQVCQFRNLFSRSIELKRVFF